MGEADFVECAYCDRRFVLAAGVGGRRDERLAPGVYEGSHGHETAERALAPPKSGEKWTERVAVGPVRGGCRCRRQAGEAEFALRALAAFSDEPPSPGRTLGVRFDLSRKRERATGMTFGEHPGVIRGRRDPRPSRAYLHRP